MRLELRERIRTLALLAGATEEDIVERALDSLEYRHDTCPCPPPIPTTLSAIRTLKASTRQTAHQDLDDLHEAVRS